MSTAQTDTQAREEIARDGARALAFLADLIYRGVIPADLALSYMRGERSASDLLDDYWDILADDLPDADPYLATVREHKIAALLAEISQ